METVKLQRKPQFPVLVRPNVVSVRSQYFIMFDEHTAMPCGTERNMICDGSDTGAVVMVADAKALGVIVESGTLRMTTTSTGYPFLVSGEQRVFLVLSDHNMVVIKSPVFEVFTALERSWRSYRDCVRAGAGSTIEFRIRADSVKADFDLRPADTCDGEETAELQYPQLMNYCGNTALALDRHTLICPSRSIGRVLVLKPKAKDIGPRPAFRSQHTYFCAGHENGGYPEPWQNRRYPKAIYVGIDTAVMLMVRDASGNDLLVPELREKTSDFFKVGGEASIKMMWSERGTVSYEFSGFKSELDKIQYPFVVLDRGCRHLALTRDLVLDAWGKVMPRMDDTEIIAHWEHRANCEYYFNSQRRGQDKRPYLFSFQDASGNNHGGLFLRFPDTGAAFVLKLHTMAGTQPELGTLSSDYGCDCELVWDHGQRPTISCVYGDVAGGKSTFQVSVPDGKIKFEDKVADAIKFPFIGTIGGILHLIYAPNRALAGSGDPRELTQAVVVRAWKEREDASYFWRQRRDRMPRAQAYWNQNLYCAVGFGFRFDSGRHLVLDSAFEGLKAEPDGLCSVFTAAGDREFSDRAEFHLIYNASTNAIAVKLERGAEGEAYVSAYSRRKALTAYPSLREYDDRCGLVLSDNCALTWSKSSSDDIDVCQELDQRYIVRGGAVTLVDTGADPRQGLALFSFAAGGSTRYALKAGDQYWFVNSDDKLEAWNSSRSFELTRLGEGSELVFDADTKSVTINAKAPVVSLAWISPDRTLALVSDDTVLVPSRRPCSACYGSDKSHLCDDLPCLEHNWGKASFWDGSVVYSADKMYAADSKGNIFKAVATESADRCSKCASKYLATISCYRIQCCSFERADSKPVYWECIRKNPR